jgi:subtilisin family serine protease
MREDLTRREVMAGAGVAFLGFGGSSSLTTTAERSLDAQVQTGTDATPVWHIWVSDDRRDSLDQWIRDADSRELRNEHDKLGFVTVSAPDADIGTGFVDRVSGTGLQGKGWVSKIEPVLSVSYPKPLESLASEQAWQTPVSRLARVLAGTPSSTDVAFSDDARPNTMRETRSLTNTTSVDASDVTVAVIDTGVNDTPVFEDGNGESRLIPQSKDLITADTGADAAADPNGHGTFVASQIAARAPSSQSEHDGYLPNADVLALRALDEDGSGTTERIADAITYATDNTADILNLSLGAPTWSGAIEEALAYAVENDVIPVAAAGNSRTRTVWTATPADSEFAIGVGASTAPESGDPTDAQSAYFSNVGPDPATTDLSSGESKDATALVAAPGMQQEALVDTNNVRTLSGTSMATPNVVGAIGQLLASTSGLSYDQVRTRLRKHSRRAPDIAAVESQAGLVDVKAMVNGTERAETQSEAMTSNARARDESYRGLSDLSGGVLPW